MASYKIYFLNFCYKNWPSSDVKWHRKLQNATQKGCFMKKRLKRPFWGSFVAVEQFKKWVVSCKYGNLCPVTPNS